MLATEGAGSIVLLGSFVSDLPEEMALMNTTKVRADELLGLPAALAAEPRAGGSVLGLETRP